MSELFRRHPINKAGVLPEREVGEVCDVDNDIQSCAERSNHSVTVTGEKFICVLHWGVEAVVTRRVGSRQAGHRASVCWQLSPRAGSRQAGHRARAVLSGASWSVQSSGPPHLHRRLPHHPTAFSAYRAQASRQFVFQFLRSPAQSPVRLCSSTAQLTPGEAQKVPLQWTIGSQGIVFVFAFVFSLDLTVEILSMRKENESCDSQLRMSSKLRWRLLLKLALVVVFAPQNPVHCTNKWGLFILWELVVKTYQHNPGWEGRGQK